MNSKVKIAFETQVIEVSITAILPTKMLHTTVQDTLKYKRIIASVGEIGLIEPLSVALQKDKTYLLLDGHVRLEAMKLRGAQTVQCIIAADDESFTFNKRVNRLPPIQEHYMIVRAIEAGVPQETIARTFDMDVAAIRQRLNLLKGISPEVADLLKDKSLSANTFQKIRKMKPLRQLEVAELMVSANNYTLAYVKALLVATKPDDLYAPEEVMKSSGLTKEQMARLEREMSAVSQSYKEVEASYGDDMLDLVVSARYIEKLLCKPEIVQFLERYHPEFLEEFRGIVSTVTLDQSSVAAQ